jgi:hypothetical protein
VDELFEVVVFRRTIERIYELTQQDAFSKENIGNFESPVPHQNSMSCGKLLLQ